MGNVHKGVGVVQTCGMSRFSLAQDCKPNTTVYDINRIALVCDIQIIKYGMWSTIDGKIYIQVKHKVVHQT